MIHNLYLKMHQVEQAAAAVAVAVEEDDDEESKAQGKLWFSIYFWLTKHCNYLGNRVNNCKLTRKREIKYKLLLYFLCSLCHLQHQCKAR